ncbi:MAG: translation initiation factor IF-2 [Actinomycetota bacterium]
MSIRVHEVAKQLGLSSKEAVEKLVALGVPVKGHASSVTEADIKRLTESLNGGAKPAPDPPAKSSPPVPAPVPSAGEPKLGARAADVATAPSAKASGSRSHGGAAPAPGTRPPGGAAQTGQRPGQSQGGQSRSPGGPGRPVQSPRRDQPRPPGQSPRRDQPRPAGQSPRRDQPRPMRDQAPPDRREQSSAAAERTASATEQRPQAAPAGPAEAKLAPAVSAEAIHVPHGVTVEELAEKMDKSAGEIIKSLLMLGEMKTLTQSLSDSLVELVAEEFAVRVQIVSIEEEAKEQEAELEAELEKVGSLEPRAPIVTVMGHVDHGKSSILQQFRKKEMLSLEAGGITQAIGAYQVHGGDGRVVTFIDTPGHEAFTQMRARGAQVTDVAILVVAADDGVQPQTVEAMDHARAAAVPIIVAVNKIDKPEADPTRARQQLAELGLQPEEWGGDTVFVDVSAKKGTNLDDLLDMIHLVSDLQELTANPHTSARGVSIEAHLDKGRGPVATLIVQKGTLKVGDPLVCGPAWAKVRALTDEAGHRIKKAGPSQPVLVTGWSQLPQAGDEFKVVSDDREAKRIAQEREGKLRQAEFAEGGKAMSLEDLLSKTRSGELPELKLIVKANTQGAIEALGESIDKLDQTLVRTTVQRRAVGAINENDVWMAKASGAIVVGFAVRPDAGARQLAEKEGVDVRLYEVIYQLLDDIQKATAGLLAPLEEEIVLGSAEVREVFRTPKAVVAGSYVTEGKVTRNARARLLRDGKIVHTGEVGSLRRFKDDAREVAAGYECGITITGYNDIKVGDVVETFEMREVARS